MGIRSQLHPRSDGKKIYLPPACHTLSRKEKISLCQCLRRVKVPQGYQFGQCLSISVIQLWILHLTETSVRAGNSDVYGFLEPQSIQRSGQSQFESESYIKSWIQSSKRDVYLGAYLNGGHWQMVVILPKENLVIWFCSLHNRPDNYLKGIINSALKGLDDTPQPKSKAAARWIVVKCNRQKGITECGYYMMHWMSTIILGSFRNNWETYFNEVRPLEAERFKALQWAQYYLKVRNQT
ncbi:hypothetical protein HKD37_15G043029 [Glycine soja]